MNRRLSLNQCNRKSSHRGKHDDSEPAENADTVNCLSAESIKDEQLDDPFPDDIPLIKLTPFGKQNDCSEIKSISQPHTGKFAFTYLFNSVLVLHSYRVYRRFTRAYVEARRKRTAE